MIARPHHRKDEGQKETWIKLVLYSLLLGSSLTVYAEEKNENYFREVSAEGDKLHDLIFTKVAFILYMMGLNLHPSTSYCPPGGVWQPRCSNTGSDKWRNGLFLGWWRLWQAGSGWVWRLCTAAEYWATEWPRCVPDWVWRTVLIDSHQKWAG